jgi:hypothetical protein
MTNPVVGFAAKLIRQEHVATLFGAPAAYCYAVCVACTCSMTRNLHVTAITLVGAGAIVLGDSTLSAFAGGSLDPNVPRGISISKFAVSGTSIQESCIVPKHIPFSEYREADENRERVLCKYNFYESSGTTDSSGAVVVCPKTSSTSAGVLLYDIPDGHTKSELQNTSTCVSLEANDRPPSPVKEIAKFKQTDDDRTCTSASSILGYYHVSRALGNIAQIAPAVIRTMDFDQHGKVVDQALSVAKVTRNGPLRKSWSNFAAFKSGSSKNPASLFTIDNSQIFGALVSKDHGTTPYKDWITDASSSQTNIGTVSAFRNVTNPQSAAKIIGSQSFTQSTAQNLLAMRDMSEMLLIDTLMQQNDRTSGGNIAASTEVLYKDGSDFKTDKTGKNIISSLPQFTVKRLHLVDNDCGLIEGPGAIVKQGYLGKVNHMHPKTYVRLMQFASKWENDPSVKTFFETEALFSPAQISSFDGILLKTRDTLRAKCKQSDHFLDLDIDDYFNGKEPDKSLCDADSLPIRAPTP